ncbi:MAG: hypothetical protein A3G33_03150 [Omnitrophica bacterium RIFCSPLOWO2_12_FULL_44_17]|uniref:Glycosyltransferase RgtA/B/C/D-like domain-containing protein n=1 Tax=Candidatus Danuiimicrobium aquiferis TaxID=1801832 RepID=A0A1G1KTS6_9BACT|nr:MAG: hypothetical protein A3B72_06695 [Omnitrophica bacterium RIFCSPHIGHO2_02_FULL_45_28]OGW96316.1 MAG: hypothetical protein A3G33_03150 [Omnitrophica bacterium RIFCSPLOWO2_12_FULL_44_17]OGX04251.1 MAG: hypothetical protein A3J12_10885 [Omnitrophica bacterium RIFCSPLOWO2_02_FULL_44_11]
MNQYLSRLTFLKKEPIIVFFFLAIILALNAIGLYHKQFTYDEGRHYEFGTKMLELKSDRYDDSKMPVSALNAMPLKIWTMIEPYKWSQPFRSLRKMQRARFVTTLFSVLLATFVFRWAKALYGITAGFISLTLYSFSPNILAHSRLITTDLFGACMTTIALYSYWRFIKAGRWGRALGSAFVLGLCQLTKYSCVFLYPIFLLIAIAIYSPVVLELIRKRSYLLLLRNAGRFFATAVLFIIISLIPINLGFYCNKSFTKLSQYTFKSDFFTRLQPKILQIADFPVPTPVPYLEGLDWVKYHDETGKGFGNVYLFETLRKGKGFIGYYFFAWLYKVPLTAQLFFILALLTFFRKKSQRCSIQDELFILIPVVFFFIYLNFFFQAQMGIRLFLAVIPLVHVFCGRLFINWPNFRPAAKNLTIGLLVFYIVSTLSYTPHFLSYFNELVLDRKFTYRILGDSNIDWGENQWYLEQYVKKHPESIVTPPAPIAGRVIVTINDLTGVNEDPNKYRWLRENFKPVDHVAYSYLVYQVSGDQLQRIINNYKTAK